MSFNNRYNLIFRKNKLIASQIDGQSPAMYLHASDLLLFDAVAQNPQQNLADLANNDWLQALIPGINSFQLQSRLQQLKSGHVISDGNNQEKAQKTIAVNNVAVADTALPDKLIVSKHLAFFRQQGQWCYWSAPLQQYIQCQSNDLILLTQYIEKPDFKNLVIQFGELISEQHMMQLMMQFLKSGVLIDATDIPEQVSCASNADLPVQQINQKFWWQNMAPDPDRIPIYFVPHMKNHYPLALGVLYSAIKHYENGLLLKKFQLIPINYLDPKAFLSGPYKKFGPGVWLFSNYMWSIDINMQISEAVKTHNPANITIHGGPSTPDYPQADKDFMNSHRSVDISVHGEGEICINHILNNISKDYTGKLIYDRQLATVEGITFRNEDDSKSLIRTAKRKRTASPDSIPSPYLTGCFDGYGVEVEAAIIETNRGCPFGCTFCDWGSATNQKVRKFDLQRVKDEIDWIAGNQVRVLWIADANYGLYDRDIEMAKYIVESKQKTGYPEEVVVNYTKNSTWRLVEIIKIFNDGGIISQGIISIQTTDEKTLEVINRKNIKTEKYDELTKVFYDLRLPLSTDLMMGLPGITIDAFNKDLQKYIDMDVSIKAYPTQLLPNSPMADPEYMEKYQIKTDDNNFLISTFSYTEQDLKWMKGMYHMYTIGDGYGLLRYLLRYMQWQHNILAVDFLSDLLKFTNKNPGKYPKITWAVRFFITDKTMPGGWYDFYQQIGQYITEQYSIPMDSGFRTVFLVSQYCMPDDTLSYPITVKIPHDFTAYFTAKRQADSKQSKYALVDYPPSNFQVSDPNNMVNIDMDYLQYDSHQYFWELHSPVSRPKSSSEFINEKSATGT
ncbi:MAG: radical SAM protein [Proteobacteria bacterium]|nr:MAG: radical SAM protein [Pseudomonadota bacterium]